MYKSIAVTLATMLVGVFVTSSVFAQQGRGRSGMQQRGGSQQGVRQGGGSQGGLRQGGQQQAGRSSNRQNGSNTLTAYDQQGLILMREEEKLARDVYATLHAKWGADIFSRIARAESQHMNAVGNLLRRNGIPDPIVSDAVGSFSNPRFKQLYGSLVAAGSTSLNDALKVGLRIEEMDIADLRVAINATKDQEIRRVLGQLLRGSQNHLRAFATQLKAVGGTYIPTSLSQVEFDQIANSTGASGPGMGKSNGQEQRKLRKGQGRKASAR